MNINISIQTTKNSLGNNIKGKSQTTEDCFGKFFSGLAENNLVDNDTDSKLNSCIEEQEKDNKTDEKILELMLMLMNLSGNLDENTDLNKFIQENNIDISVLSDSSKLLNLLENLKNNNENLGLENNSAINDLLTKLQNEDTSILKNINNILETKNLDLDKIQKDLTNLDLQNNNQTSEVLSDENEKINSQLNTDNEYQKLEVSGLSKKNSIVQKNLSSNDDEITKLESILDKSDIDINKLSVSNNISSSNNQNSISENVTTSSPIQTIRQEYLGDDIVKAVKYLKSNGQEEINIKISPRELGDMTIKLIKDGQDTKLAISVAKKEVFDLINKNTTDITKHLNDININIKVKNISVHIETDTRAPFSNNFDNEFKNNSNQNQQKNNRNSRVNIEQIDQVDSVNEEIQEDDNINILI